MWEVFLPGTLPGTSPLERHLPVSLCSTRVSLFFKALEKHHFISVWDVSSLSLSPQAFLLLWAPQGPSQLFEIVSYLPHRAGTGGGGGKDPS